MSVVWFVRVSVYRTVHVKDTCPLCGKPAVFGFLSAHCAGFTCPNFSSKVFTDWVNSLAPLPAKDDDYGDPDQWTRLYQQGNWGVP